MRQKKITRRDFLNGCVAVESLGASGVSKIFGADDLLAAAALDELSPETAADYYPPAKMGMRGNHDGTFTFAHLLRDGQSWNDSEKLPRPANVTI